LQPCKDGEISYITRNHYTEYDWDINNSWLVSDITRDLAGSRVKSVTSVYDKSLFFNRVGLNTYFAPDTFKWEYIPANSITPELLGSLKPGDFVNIVRGYDDNDVWVGHVGLITKNDDGTTNFLHSTNPRVKEEPIMDYLNRNLQKNEERRLHNQKARAYNQMLKEKNSNKKLKRTLPYFLGFKFLRLNDDPMWELFKIDGFGAPRVTIPSSY